MGSFKYKKVWIKFTGNGQPAIASWSVRSEGLQFLNKYKLHHSLGSYKTFFNLAVLLEIRENAAEY